MRITPAQAAAELLRRDDAATAWGKLSGDERCRAAIELMLKEHMDAADKDLLRLCFMGQLKEIVAQADKVGDRRSSKRASKVLASFQ